jgi:mRNA deadenylase 3'-5' endonuclease subunit Ccr4
LKKKLKYPHSITGVMSIPRRQWKKHCQDESDSRKFNLSDTIILSSNFICYKGHFMVMSYNLLAPHYCTPEKYPKTNQEFLDWDYRRRKILDEIAYYSADFICLQVYLF